MELLTIIIVIYKNRKLFLLLFPLLQQCFLKRKLCQPRHQVSLHFSSSPRQPKDPCLHTNLAGRATVSSPRPPITTIITITVEELCSFFLSHQPNAICTWQKSQSFGTRSNSKACAWLLPAGVVDDDIRGQ